MIGRPVAGGGRGHVAHHAVRAPADRTPHLVQHLRIGHVTDKNLDPVQHIGFQKINTNKHRAAAAKPAAVGDDLQPAAGGASQIDNRHSRLQQFIAVINLFQLQRGA